MKVLDIPSSGKRGIVVAYQSRFGLCHRQHVHPANPQTPAREHMRRAFANFARAWSRVLTQAQRDLWDEAGPKVKSATRLGSGPLTGQQLFQGINSARARIGLPPLWEPPAPVIFGPNPVGQLRITNDDSGLRLRVQVTGPITEDIMVFGQAPCSAGRRKRRNISYLGLLPAAQDGLSEFTALYIARFGVPRPGEKIFIVTRQQKDGWEHYDQETSEVVPPGPQQSLPADAIPSSPPSFPSLPSLPAPQALTTTASPLPSAMLKGCTRDAQGIGAALALESRDRSEPGCPVGFAADAVAGAAMAQTAVPGAEWKAEEVPTARPIALTAATPGNGQPACRRIWGIHPMDETATGTTFNWELMKITEAIAAEHVSLLKWFDEIEKVLPRLTSREDVGALAALVGGVLTNHGDLETEFAFVPLDRALGRKGQLARLAEEHHEISRQLAEVRLAATCAEACRRLRAALRASREHFFAEEGFLFPVIERVLRPQQLIALGERYDRAQQSRTTLKDPWAEGVPAGTTSVDAPITPARPDSPVRRLAAKATLFPNRPFNNKHSNILMATSPNGSKKQTFQITAPQAKRVLLVGDFTQWQEHAIPLQKLGGGVWATTVDLPPGKHTYRFIVDGEWRDDPECASRVPNPFGGQDMIREAA